MSATVTYLPPGREAEDLECGDLLLIEGQSFASVIVRLFDGSPVTHAAVARTRDMLVEALAGGVCETPLADYADHAYYVVRLGASAEDREQMARFLDSVIAARWSYGWGQFIGAGLANLTGARIVVGIGASAICSGLASETVVRAGEIFPRPPALMSPTGLLRYFGEPPEVAAFLCARTPIEGRGSARDQ